MKFIKANLLLVILGAVVLIAIASVFYPFGSWTSGLQEEMETRYKHVTAAADKIRTTDITVPGFAQAKGIPSPEFTRAKVEMSDKIKKESAQVVQLAASKNSTGRVVIERNTVVPLLSGKKLEHVLPTNDRSQTDPMVVKETYDAFLKGLTTKLTGVEGENSGTAPDSAEIQAAYQAQKAAQDALKPPGVAAMGMGNDAQAQAIFTKNRVLERASKIQMYVDAHAFQVRPFLSDTAPPNEQQIFEALVDSWFQQDVVNAIDAVNKPLLEAAGRQDAKKKNVGSSAVKRVMRIVVGSDAQQTASRIGTFASSGAGGGAGGAAPAAPTQLFTIPLAPAGVQMDPTAIAGLPAQPNTIDPMRSLTGRSSGAEYDVVMMTINMDIDPAHLTRFIDALYRQNMGYTVVNVRTRTVDPLDRISGGYIYGENQVIEVELTVEGMLFRNWTTPIMPLPIRTILGLGAFSTEPAPAPAEPAQPAPAE